MTNAILLTRDELKAKEDAAFQRGVERGKFEAASELQSSRATIDGLRSERDEARTGLAVRLMKVRDALSVTTPILGGMRVTIHPARAAEYAATVDAAIAAITMAAPNYPLIERINKMLDDIGENFFAKDERTKGTLMPLLRDCRASLTTARADGIEVERLRAEKWEDAGMDCPKCASPVVLCRMHEDSEGHEDWEYRCADPECKHHWWVDGIDS